PERRPRRRRRRSAPPPCRRGHLSRSSSPSRGGNPPRPCPGGRGGSASARRSPRTGTPSRGHSHALTIRGERLAGDALVRLAVARRGLLHHLARERRRRRLAVPPARVEPVADVL